MKWYSVKVKLFGEQEIVWDVKANSEIEAKLIANGDLCKQFIDAKIEVEAVKEYDEEL